MKKWLVGSVVLLLLLPVPVFAQGGDDCPGIFEEALANAAALCGDVAPGDVCLVHPEVGTTLNCDQLPDFSAPGDMLSLEKTCCLNLSPFSPAGEWGVALLNIQPTAAASGVTMALVGDVHIQNAASAFSELDIEVVSATALYDGPGSHYTTLRDVPVGETLIANACNCTGNWLRVLEEGGVVGWIPAGRVDVLGEADALPVVERETPIYGPMQAFTFQTDDAVSECANAPANGILLQTPDGAEPVQMQINGVGVALSATAFLQAQPEGDFTLDVLAGVVDLTLDDFTLTVPPGVRAVIPMTSLCTPEGTLHAEPFAVDDVATLPLALLPEAVDPLAGLARTTPEILGLEPCNAVSNMGTLACPLHFINSDGDALVQMDVEFVYAAQGEWTGSVHEDLAMLAGDSMAGVVGWDVSCVLGDANFIGPVEWSITVTDEAGHISPPFAASFNCVES